MKKTDLSYIAGGIVKQCSCFGTLAGSSANNKHRLSYDPAIPLLGTDPQEVKTYVHVHAAVFKMDNQQGPTVQHIELCSVLLLAAWMGEEFWGEWICVYE